MRICFYYFILKVVEKYICLNVFVLIFVDLNISVS